MKIHELIHNKGENHIICKICGKKFARKDYLKIHELIHEKGEKHLKCKICGKIFHKTSTTCKDEWNKRELCSAKCRFIYMKDRMKGKNNSNYIAN